MAELDRARNAELGETGEILGREQLRMLDARPELFRPPHVPSCLERVERVAVRAIADRVYGDGETAFRRTHDRLLELHAARDLDTAPVQQVRRLGAERPIHERLHVAEPQQVVSERPVQRQREQRVELVPRMGLPDA